MANSKVSRQAAKLLRHAPEDRVDQAGEYFVEAGNIFNDEVESLSAFAERCTGAIISSDPYAKSDGAAFGFAISMGYALRIGASRRGVAAPPPEELGADLMPRAASGQVDYFALNVDDEQTGELRGELWEGLQRQVARERRLRCRQADADLHRVAGDDPLR